MGYLVVLCSVGRSRDAVADEAGVPFDLDSLEMLYWGMWSLWRACDKGKAHGPSELFAAPENLGLESSQNCRKRFPA